MQRNLAVSTRSPIAVLDQRRSRADGTAVPCERTLAAMWSRARVCLGDVALKAIFERTIALAARTFSMLRRVRVGMSGVWVEPGENLPLEGVEFLLRQLRLVLGSLSGEVLGPPLDRILADHWPRFAVPTRTLAPFSRN
jgi:hypothetical protein